MKSHFVLLALVATLGLLQPCRGDSPALPYTYKRVSENGNFVFVMLAPFPTSEELKGYSQKYQSEVRAIRELYSRSGMYRNDSSKEPLWTVDWWACVEVPGDGVHIIREGPWSSLEKQGHAATKSDLEQQAFSIYANGKLIRSFKISELVENPALMQASVSHFEWLRKSKLIDEKKKYEIDTYDGNHIVFSLETGAILTKIHKPVPQRKPEDMVIAPATKWLGSIVDVKIMSECREGLITKQDEFEKVWRVLRRLEEPPKVDFSKEFVWIWTLKGWNITDAEFRAPEYEDDNVATATHSTWTGDKRIPGFSYAIAVFKRDRLDLVNGKVLVKDQNR